MITNAIKGASHVVNGFRLLKLRGIKRYVVIPLIINIILFAGVIYFGAGKIDELFEQYLPNWLAWLEFILWPLIVVASLLVVFFTFTIIANIIGAPFNGVLSEKIEEHLTQQRNNTNEGYLDLLRNAGTGISNEVRKLIYFAVRIIPLIIIFLIPGLNLIAPILWIIFGAWMLAIEYLDYPMGNHKLSFKQQLVLLKNNRFLCLGFGLVLLFMTITPILNFFSMPVGVAAATSLWVKSFKKDLSIISVSNKGD